MAKVEQHSQSASTSVTSTRDAYNYAQLYRDASKEVSDTGAHPETFDSTAINIHVHDTLNESEICFQMAETIQTGLKDDTYSHVSSSESNVWLCSVEGKGLLKPDIHMWSTAFLIAKSQK